MSAIDLKKALWPKLIGTIIIEWVTKEEPLDFFATVSLSVLNEELVREDLYSAANAYQCAYSYFRALGKAPGNSLSINFDFNINSNGIGHNDFNSFMRILSSRYQGYSQVNA